MKKVILMAAVAAVTALAGCNKNEDTRPYYWTLEVKNETSKHIDLTYWEHGQPSKNTVVIGTGQTGTLSGIHHYGPDAGGVKLTDPLAGGDHVPFNYKELHQEGKSVEINFNDHTEPGSIGQRENWGFRSSEYEYIYTLTVNNELLEKLMPGYPEQAGLTK